MVVHYICGGGGDPLTIDTRLQMVCTFIDALCKYATRIMRSSLMLLVGGWLRWPGDCSLSRLTALLLGRVLGVLLFTEARSMGRAIRWSPMKPESWSGWFPLKSSPTCSYRWLHCDLQNVPRVHANCTAGNVRANWSVSSWWPANGTQSQSYFVIDSLSVSTSWCRAHSGTYDQMLFSFRSLISEVFSLVSFWAPSLTRGRVCHLSV
jgi:hypothetical protein